VDARPCARGSHFLLGFKRYSLKSNKRETPRGKPVASQRVVRLFWVAGSMSLHGAGRGIQIQVFIPSRLRWANQQPCTNKNAVNMLFTALTIKPNPKNCGLLVFLGGLPQAPSRRQPAAPLLLLFDCVQARTPFPQKEPKLASLRL
jgi:hypothetical protein